MAGHQPRTGNGRSLVLKAELVWRVFLLNELDDLSLPPIRLDTVIPNRPNPSRVSPGSMASGGLKGSVRPSGTLILLHEVVVWALGRHLPLRRFRNDPFGHGFFFDARPRCDRRGIVF